MNFSLNWGGGGGGGGGGIYWSFIWSLTLFERFLYTYVCPDSYSETVRVAIIEVWFSQHVLLMTFSIIEITEGIVLAI